MSKKAKFLNPTEPQPVRVFTVSKYPTVAIPKHMARYLGIVEGQSVLEARILDGKLVYSVKPVSPAFGFETEDMI